MLAESLICFVASAVFGGVRWWLLVRGAAPIPFRAGIATLLATSAADLLLPLRAGTVALFQILYRRYGVHRATVVGTAGAGGIIDILATVALVISLSPVLAFVVAGTGIVLSYGIVGRQPPGRRQQVAADRLHIGGEAGHHVVLLQLVVAGLEAPGVQLHLLPQELQQPLVEASLVAAALRRRDDVDEAAHHRVVAGAPA